MGQLILVAPSQYDREIPMTKEFKSTNIEAASLILSFYGIIKSAMEMYKDPKEQSDAIISKVPEIKYELDKIILNRSY